MDEGQSNPRGASPSLMSLSDELAENENRMDHILDQSREIALRIVGPEVIETALQGQAPIPHGGDRFDYKLERIAHEMQETLTLLGIIRERLGD